MGGWPGIIPGLGSSAPGTNPGTELSPVKFDTSQSTSVRPRACVVLTPHVTTGSPQPAVFAVKSFEINKNCHGATNTASFVLTYKDNPDWTKQLQCLSGGAVLDDCPIYVEIWAGFPQNPSPTPSTSELGRVFYGVIDLYTPTDMESTEFHCRSIAAPLCTDRVTTALQKLKTTELVAQFAGQYGMGVDIGVPSPYTVADVYGQEQIIGLKQLIKWDVLLKCAIADDADLWEDDGILHYVQPQAVQRAQLNLTYGTNVKSFKGTHSPQFNRNIEVWVHSGTPREHRAITTRIKNLTGSQSGIQITTVQKYSKRVPVWGTNSATTTTIYSNGNISVSTGTVTGGPSSGSTTAIEESGKEKYWFTVNNQTNQQCEDLAKKFWRDISMHEYQADITIAITDQNLFLIGITTLINFQGYGMSKFNALYWPRSYVMKFQMAEPESDTAEGWTIQFHCVNHTPPVGGV